MKRVGVAISGGGHRAALFGLGALLYVVDAGKGADLACVSSVSGGSLTNAYAALRTDLRTVGPAAFRAEMKPVARAAATKGTLWSAPLTWAYLLFGGLLLAAGIVGIALAGDWWLRLLLAVATLLVLGWWAMRRGWVCAKSFEHALFQRTRLDSIHNTIDHVICATDLQAGHHLFFSGRFVCGWYPGWGTPGNLRLSRAVQASAALPGAFPAAVLPASRHHFQDGQRTGIRSLLLVDGGVYDNMATEWPTGVENRNTQWQTHTPNLQVPEELLVVNASAGLGWTNRKSPRVPLLGEVRGLLADEAVLYDQTTAVRRRALLRRFWLAQAPDQYRHGETALDGTMIQIDRSPFDVPNAFKGGSDDYAQRSNAALAQLASEDPVAWTKIASANSSVKTTLSKVGEEAGARLMRHAYVLTMINAHVLLDYPLQPIPPLDDFVSLIRD